jgi:alpha-ketoglutarate-dependent taurine dioxygenase
MTQAESRLDIRPVTGRIGAEIAGVRLSADLAPETVQAILNALYRHKVVFFRGQTHLDDVGQEAFAQRLGAPEAHPTLPTLEGTRYMLELDSAVHGRAAIWHTDVTFTAAYPMASILRGVVIPPAGGDTMFANTAQAYEDLIPELKALADSLWVTHSNLYDYGRPKGAPSARMSNFASTVHETEHPLVRVHPVTGERTLVLGQFAQKVVGLNTTDSQRLIGLFQDQITRPENVVRWRWAVGDVVIWDNRATQHFAVNDYGDQHRVVRRVTLQGDVPVSVDGRRSRTVSPPPERMAAE